MELHLTNQEKRERIFSRYFGVASIKGDNRALVRKYLLAAIWAAIGVPLLFYLKFGTINWFSISFTIFLVVLCLLFALGFHFYPKTEYHTDVPMEGNLADRVGAFWLVACAFGPFFGWIVTAIGPSESSWKWQYFARAFLAVILPVITAVPLVRYARGKAALIAIPLLLVITALPISSCIWVLADLHDGPTRLQIDHIGQDKVLWSSSDSESHDQMLEQLLREVPPDHWGEIVWLKHTDRILSLRTFTR